MHSAVLHKPMIFNTFLEQETTQGGWSDSTASRPLPCMRLAKDGPRFNPLGPI